MKSACTFLLLAAASAATLAAPAFSEDETRRIVAHGPWPAPWTRDPSNRVSGDANAIDLGERLFFERRLSVNGEISCSRCHLPERNWSDGLPRAVGLAEVDRNAPSVVNVRYHHWFGWDGAHDSLWAQSINPMLDPRELGMSAASVAKFVRSDRDLACRYGKTFGGAPGADDEKILVDAAKALAAFQETLVSGRTAFDDFRDALAKAERPPRETYSEPAQRGLKIFIGKGGCTACHSGPNFTGGEFFNTGLSRFAPRGQPDPGRQAGIRQLKESRFNLLGGYNDDKTGASAARTREASVEKAGFGEFKVPSLRNLILTAPYGRDGGVETLAEVVRHYAALDTASLHAKDGRPAKPLDLTAREQTDLVVFLESLSTFSNSWRPDDGGVCH